jgi:hypothetical protein
MKFLFICYGFVIYSLAVGGVEVIRIFEYNDHFLNQSMPADKYIALPPLSKGDRRIPFDVFVVPNAYYWHHNPHAIIMDEQNRVIEPASGSTNGFFGQQMFRNPEVKFGQDKNHTLDGNLLIYRPSCQYWHVHIEAVTQLMLYQKAGIFERFRGQKNYVNKVDCGSSNKVHDEIMEFYGFKQLLQDWKVLDLNAKQGFGYQITNNYSLITTTTTGAAGYIPMNIATRFMNEKAMENYQNHRARFHPKDRNDLSYFHRRIFIGRDDKATGSRGILNLPAVEEVLKKYDIYYFNPGVDASYVKQMYIFTHAELVIGVSGTGFSTNIAFCHVNNTILLELIPPAPKTGTGEHVAVTSLGFKYYYPLKIGYNGTSWSPESPFYLNVTKLDNFLFDVLADQRRK